MKNHGKYLEMGGYLLSKNEVRLRGTGVNVYEAPLISQCFLDHLMSFSELFISPKI